MHDVRCHLKEKSVQRLLQHTDSLFTARLVGFLAYGMGFCA